jgi:hypothetical protein
VIPWPNGSPLSDVEGAFDKMLVFHNVHLEIMPPSVVRFVSLTDGTDVVSLAIVKYTIV